MKYALMMLVMSAASVQAQSVVDGSAGGMEPDVAEAVVADVSAQFADPLAVQFKSLNQSDGAVCGLVNAKNSYGAYAGFKPFRYIVERRKTYLVNAGC